MAEFCFNIPKGNINGRYRHKGVAFAAKEFWYINFLPQAFVVEWVFSDQGSSDLFYAVQIPAATVACDPFICFNAQKV